MWLTYDDDGDSAYIYLMNRRTRPGESVRTTGADVPDEEAFVFMDWDANGRLLGLEVLSASRILDPELLATAVPPGSPPPDSLKAT